MVLLKTGLLHIEWNPFYLLHTKLSSKKITDLNMQYTESDRQKSRKYVWTDWYRKGFSEQDLNIVAIKTNN